LAVFLVRIASRFLLRSENFSNACLRKQPSTSKKFKEFVFSHCNPDQPIFKYKLSNTDVNEALENADGLLSTITDVCDILECSKQVQKTVQETLLRVRKGVKAELLSLVSLKGVGRITARKLYKGGIKTKEDFLLPQNWQKSSQILGEGRTKMILRKNGLDA
jgi:helicase